MNISGRIEELKKYAIRHRIFNAYESLDSFIVFIKRKEISCTFYCENIDVRSPCLIVNETKDHFHVISFSKNNTIDYFILPDTDYNYYFASKKQLNDEFLTSL